MDYDLIISELRDASAFDLYRLNVVIGTLLEDPSRTMAIKANLRPGMEVNYFDEQRNRMVPVRVLQVRRRRVVVEELDNGKRWAVPLYSISIDGKPADTLLDLTLKLRLQRPIRLVSSLIRVAGDPP